MNCKFRLDTREEKFYIDCLKANQITIIHTCDILEYDGLVDLEHPTTSISKITMRCSDICSILSNIPKNQRELTLSTLSDRLEIGNYISHPDKDVQTLRLHMKIDKAELIEYQVENEHRLIVCAKDFSSFLEQAEAISEEFTLTFVKSGKPLLATAKSNDGLIIVEIAMSTLREETLRKTRKPPEIQTYRELMGSFIGNRNKVVQNDNDNLSLRDLSDSEMNRVMSPRVETCGISGINSVKTSSRQKSDSKRKSNENLDSIDIDNSTVAKKRKSLEQNNEDQRVSHILAALQDSNLDFSDDEGNKDQTENNVQGLNQISINEEVNVEVHNEDKRRTPFNADDLNFPSSYIHDDPNETHVSFENEPSLNHTTNERKNLIREQRESINKFGMELKLATRTPPPIDPSEILAYDSDPDSD
jgi:hypothetical protein